MKVKKEMYVHWEMNYDGSDNFSLSVCDMSKYGYVLVGKQTIEFEAPDNFNPVPTQIDMLNKERERVTDEFNKRIAQIKEQISNLQCIGYAEVV